MTLEHIVTTLVGAALFPFVIRLLWGHFTDEFGPFGGFMSALWIVGSMWALNHGYSTINGGNGLIYQSGAWVDMGTAAGVGLIVASMARGAKFDAHSSRNVIAAIIGGILGGLILALA
ncbi:MAG: hypothetical protein GXY98_06340 [Erysipelothrix sp.]|nr:hypothetical protein [Erysipelothrix sp.]